MSAPDLAQFSLAGRLAVVVGAASGIGRATAQAFARAGAELVLADRDSDGVEATATAIAASGGQATTRVVDVRERDQLNALADFASERGPLRIWANIAGVISSFPVIEAEPEEVERILSVNLMGTYWGCAAAARAMLPQRTGSIINVSSAGADFPSPGLSAYSISKAAVNMLTRTLAAEVGSQGIRVNSIAPGYIDTPMVTYRFRTADGIDEAAKTEIFTSRAASAALRRVGTPDDIANAMIYLASDASSFVTGQIIRPNGGSVMP